MSTVGSGTVHFIPWLLIAFSPEIGVDSDVLFLAIFRPFVIFSFTFACVASEMIHSLRGVPVAPLFLAIASICAYSSGVNILEIGVLSFTFHLKSGFACFIALERSFAVFPVFFTKSHTVELL